MILNVIKKTKISVETLLVKIPNYEESIFDNIVYDDEDIIFNGKKYSSTVDIKMDYPNLFTKNKYNEECLTLIIDVNNGQVTNWPKYSKYDFYNKKIVDGGEYTLLSSDGEEIMSYQGYVPNCVGAGGWGDYLEFEIDDNSNIPDWSFGQNELDNLMKESGDELYG